jgi:hypothetical protein
MKTLPRHLGATLALITFVILTAAPTRGAATFTQQIDPAQTDVGDPVMVTITVQGGTVGTTQLPSVDGLEAGSTNLQIKSEQNDNGSFTTSVALSVSLTPVRAGDFTVPAFDLKTQEGDVLHIKAMKLHVVSMGSTPLDTAVNPPGSTPETTSASADTAPPARNGPVVMPLPTENGATPATAPDSGDSPGATPATAIAPRDKDGGPAKVFIIITPQTTQAYVGQAVPMRIDFYIRMDVNAEQNSLPTIKGSDFLMNSFTTRGQQRVGNLEGLQYECESWLTAISAPKSGDFPLRMERDTYWVKSSAGNYDPFSGMQPDLAHESITSNQLIMHVQPLPEGQPAHFTGAIGHFQVPGEAQPGSVAVGEPVTLHFTISGDGNFDYVRCPALAETSDWKIYTPKSHSDYLDESHTRAVKTFEQSIIPQINGTLPLPTSSFSYFDPTAKQYVSVPIALPEITVTGSPTPLAPTPEAGTDSEAASPPPVEGLLPNRLDLGSPQTDLTPAYRQPWFWGVQTALVSLPVVGALLLFLRFRFRRDDELAGLARQRNALQQEEDAMAQAVNAHDAKAFFTAARHAVQLQLGWQWNVSPEAITLREIRRRDPQRAEALQPLFAQADEIIYSAQPAAGLDLPGWDHRVRTELLEPRPVSP